VLFCVAFGVAFPKGKVDPPESCFDPARSLSPLDGPLLGGTAEGMLGVFERPKKPPPVDVLLGG
jgi:hypothetical protein